MAIKRLPSEIPLEDQYYHEYQSIVPDRENYNKDTLIKGLEYLTSRVLWRSFLLTGPTETEKLEEEKEFKQMWQTEKKYLEKMSLKELTEFINSKGYSTGEILGIYEIVEG